MDKKTFLTELEKSLRILKEEELRDIISEYEQHIDMKVSKGLEEEAVIADFGSLEELKAEILAAYHVRPDYEVEQVGRVVVEEPGDDIGEGQEEQTGKHSAAEGLKVWKAHAGHAGGTFGRGITYGWKKLRGWGVWCAKRLKGACVMIWRKICKAAGWCKHRILAVFSWMKLGWRGEQVRGDEPEMDVTQPGAEKVAVGGVAAGGDELEQSTAAISSTDVEGQDRRDTEAIPQKQAGDMERQNMQPVSRQQTSSASRKRGRILSWPMGLIRALWNGTARLCRWTVSAVWWSVKVCWNLWWIMLSLFLGFCGLFCLFCLGVLAVLWAQGYPLAGFTIGCLGVVLGLFSAAAFGFTLLCRVWEKNGQVPVSGGNMEVSQNA